MRSRCSGFGFLLSLVASVSFAQQPQDRPTFRAAIEAVQVDVTVTDVEGRPVSGLTEADFELLENGKPQSIKTFSAVDIPIERGEIGRASCRERVCQYV